MSNLCRLGHVALFCWWSYASPLIRAEELASPVEVKKWKRPIYRVHWTGSPIVLDGKATESAWQKAPRIRHFQFPWWQGKEKTQQSEVRMLWDDKHLFLLHTCLDTHVIGHKRPHDDPKLPQDDCFEVMVAPNPRQPTSYFNIEWNALGSYIDSHRPNGTKGPRIGSWKARGVRVGTVIRGTINNAADKDHSWTCELAIPLTIFVLQGTGKRPRNGDRWNMNINRHNYLPGKRVLQLSQWSSSGTPRPAFHAPHRFGQVVFVGRKRAAAK